MTATDIAPGTALDGIPQEILGKLVTPRPDCLIWNGATDRGYGRVWRDESAQRVHRVVYEATQGPIPEGMEIDHVCRVRMCVNPAHLEVVSRQENVRRAAPFRPKPALKTHCRQGHEYTEANTGYWSDGDRRCLTCSRATAERRRMKAVLADTG